MKKLILMFFILICNCTYSQQIDSAYQDLIVDFFSVTKIEKQKNSYLIYATKNDTVYKIVSCLSDEKSAIQIKKGRIYKFSLYSIFGNGLLNYNHVKEFNICETSIKIIDKYNKYNPNIYIANNLKGIYYYDILPSNTGKVMIINTLGR